MATYWEIPADSVCSVFSWCGCPIVGLVFTHLGFWSGNFFLIAPFPDLCLLLPLYIWLNYKRQTTHRFVFLFYIIATLCNTDPNTFGSDNNHNAMNHYSLVKIEHKMIFLLKTGDHSLDKKPSSVSDLD